MSTSKPSVLLIPGAWHQGEAWMLVADLLRDQGYYAEPLTLPSAGGPSSSTIADDAEFIRNKYLNDLIAQGRDVIVVMHSYGGVPGTECVKGFARKDLAAQGKPGGVVALVYVTAYLIHAGESLSSSLPKTEPNIIGSVNGNVTQPADPRHNFYNDLDDETAAKNISRLVHHAMPSFVTPLTYAAYRDVPTSYLFCEQDVALTPGFQRHMAAIAEEGLVRTHTCASGHSPMLSMPQRVVDVIHDAATAVSA
ncbi:hypothetical protein N7532_001860 [Penicillium argentinense]|uniref:AB hydrolase-1 domain-containing protein n=1 Tax=Penicillium argentinense TaxID=1131581 RepID=A0A9W9G397_9EURO|nr:uncharacterized protein N7532_001860 [Penicillium argentinense]KAJ5111325.1 hypothetical protein N7532_001860 [Penicillium argentinense]